MKVLTAFTYEIDDINVAVSEILDQLDLKNNLSKNAIGIITCYTEFLDSGVVSALCDALPFGVVGCTTLANGTANELGLLMLGLMVLTGDDISFSSALSDSLFDEQEAPLEEAYQKASASLDGYPVMVMTFAPLINHVGGELIAELLDKACSGIPLFGTLAMDHTRDYHKSQTIYNGKGYRNECAILLISGNIHPRFFIASISEQKAQKQKAIITQSTGNVLQAVNNVPFKEYLNTFNMIQGDNSTEGLNTIPIVLDYNDGTQPVTRAIYLLTEEGYAVCGGKMPVNSTLAIGSIDYDEVVESSGQLMKEALASATDVNGILLFPCLSRSLVLGSDALAEIKTVANELNGSLPYMMAYSGGEICPIYTDDGKSLNRFHNFTLVVCVF